MMKVVVVMVVMVIIILVIIRVIFIIIHNNNMIIKYTFFCVCYFVFFAFTAFVDTAIFDKEYKRLPQRTIPTPSIF